MGKKKEKTVPDDPVKLYLQHILGDGLFTATPEQLAELEKKIRKVYEEQKKASGSQDVDG